MSNVKKSSGECQNAGFCTIYPRPPAVATAQSAVGQSTLRVEGPLPVVECYYVG